MDRMRAIISLGVLLGTLGAARADEHDRAPLFNNLGTHHHPVTTRSKEAQRYFDQGLTLVYGFNHHEAIRSFRAAARLDPDCAMAYWGAALAYGMNINMPMMEDAVPKAYEALQKALELAPKASEKERAYIQALAKRYTAKPEKDRGPLDRAYADAMRELARRYPDDLDAATLFAEAVMDTMPWNYWTEDGKPRAGTEEVITVLESVLKRDPNHPGANHYYIHAVENSPNPEGGLPAAYRLGGLCPGAGHLVHMPSHIFLRVGYYREAAVANERAIAADEAYIAQCKAQGVYPANYYSHNAHFLWYVTMLEGRGEEALRAGRKAAAVPTAKDLQEMPHLHWLRPVPLLTLARFGRWDELLREPQPAADAPYEIAMWHYARGLAYVRQRKTEQAAGQLEALQAVAASKEAQAMEIPFFPGHSLIRLAEAILAAELAGLRGNAEEQLRGLEEAVRRQDKLPYMEPPYWYYPVRQSLGAALLQGGQVAKAEAVYREDLKRHPNNGWSLYGLLQCLRRQGRTEEAADVERRFREAWSGADVALTASCF
jgi:tetratricopeptide (TPR) repeat protein